MVPTSHIHNSTAKQTLNGRNVDTPLYDWRNKAQYLGCQQAWEAYAVLPGPHIVRLDSNVVPLYAILRQHH